MGCACSKPKRCRHCKTPYTPMPRSYSMHVHHPPQAKGDSYHFVALTSSTLGSMVLDSTPIQFNGVSEVLQDKQKNQEENDKSKKFSMGLIEAKTWSDMIEEKIPKIIPKTPITTPPGEPETINTWELMEGLEEFSPYHSPNRARSFSFDFVREESDQVVPLNQVKSRFRDNNRVPPQPMWLQVSAYDNNHSNSKSIEFDPEIIATFRKSLEGLPHNNPFCLQPLVNDKQPSKAEKYSSLDDNDTEKPNDNGSVSDFKCGKEDKIVVYFTSLRGVRKTYEDCCHVRVILKSLGIRADERDVSMHSGFKEELKELSVNNGGLGLPKVFMGKKYLGGAEEIRQMHEEGQLEKLLEPFKTFEHGNVGNINAATCEACGDIRFVPCETCSGSCKVYYKLDDEENEEESEFGFQRCVECNENGLIRCPICCD